MHISEGVLSGTTAGITIALAALAVGAGVRRMEAEHVPRVAVMSSVFFMASLIRVPIGPAHAHLILNGLMGVLLGWAVFPALLAALVLQAVFFGYGGFTTLGANVLVMGVPALACWYGVGRRIGPQTSRARTAAAGACVGTAGIVLGCGCLAAVLLLTGKEFIGIVTALLVAHLPVAVIEAAVTAAALTFIRQVRPELFCPPAAHHRSEERSHA